MIRLWGKQRANYGTDLRELACRIAISQGLDLNAILQWNVSEAHYFVSSKAWEEHTKQQEAQMQFLADIGASINKTIAACAKSTNDTIAKNISVLLNR